MRTYTKKMKDLEKLEAKKLGLVLGLRRRRQLEAALGKAYVSGEVTYLDACITQNEIDVAYQALVAVKRHRPRVKPMRSFAVDDEITSEGCTGTVVKVEKKAVTVRFTTVNRPITKSAEGHGSLYGKVLTKRFRLHPDGTYRNGQFKDPLMKAS